MRERIDKLEIIMMVSLGIAAAASLISLVLRILLMIKVLK